MTKKIFPVVLLTAMLIVPIASAARQITITDEHAEWIGNKIFRNECGGNEENLVSWNDGEGFMSLGIGHFIWYPKNRSEPFDESFPLLLKFIEQNGGALPYWLKEPEKRHCPWNSKWEFLRHKTGREVEGLRKFLIETKPLQLKFIIDRSNNALLKMLAATPKRSRPEIEKQFYRMAATPSGVYALVDYVNFKGEGILGTEGYRGHKWGLLQVLERMKGDEAGEKAVREFVKVAENLLTERVRNSPFERNEERWLAGWKNRLNTYIE